ncbi:uncharacterized protein LOC128277077 isoform X2 [Anopheles cruzii]|uniref:uncharacterized protein LOC128277077 isoform X2 n=1 Tax=Anopheles cruzii TaxID=68878 RepID=UPI0022EC7F99|nr:uncharacterized protein LOC128277077 isoform X2 [Anopheles cruzii]XP_052871502.1 uncharacterized protein LOC128277077 isoform X2 [Anopheles cruzii]XP_052871509.1 uncharacterized protein LOC128277077 isoform X2 [Anopheles cruzii]
MYIKSGHRFLSDKGQIIFPGPPTRSPAIYYQTSTTGSVTTTTTTTMATESVVTDENGNYIVSDMWQSKSSSGSDMLSDKIQMFYIYITVTITSVFIIVVLAIFGYMCYKRKGFQSIDNPDTSIETTRRRSSAHRTTRRYSRHGSKEREATSATTAPASVEDNPGQTLLR